MATIVPLREGADSGVPDDTEPRSGHGGSRKDGSLASQVPSLKELESFATFFQKRCIRRQPLPSQEPTAKKERSLHSNPSGPLPHIKPPKRFSLKTRQQRSLRANGLIRYLYERGSR
jgi:hypothetical protein